MPYKAKVLQFLESMTLRYLLPTQAIKLVTLPFFWVQSPIHHQPLTACRFRPAPCYCCRNGLCAGANLFGNIIFHGRASFSESRARARYTTREGNKGGEKMICISCKVFTYGRL